MFKIGNIFQSLKGLFVSRKPSGVAVGTPNKIIAMVSNTQELRNQLFKIALLDEGQKETSKNHGPAIAKFWTKTSYKEGYSNREPYCAAAISYWVSEWLKNPEVLKALKKTPEQAEKWRCKSAAAFGWIEWAEDNNVMNFKDQKPLPGDLCVFKFSHIGIVIRDLGDSVRTIDANTGDTNGNDGDGIFIKERNISSVKRFIRLL